MDHPGVRVVAAALVDDGRVLAALRVSPAGWEFPGGKVEPGESPQDALVRECREELGIDVECVRSIATASDGRIELQVWHVRLLSGVPASAHDHRELRWLTREQLADPDWLPLDRAVLDEVAELVS